MTETSPLMGRLTELAHTPVLLVACDYDGTLADIVVDPSTAGCPSTSSWPSTARPT